MSPGTSGGLNTISATRAIPKSDVRFIYGFNQQNVTANNICLGFQSGIINPKTLPLVQSNGAGNANLNINVPANLAGVSFVLQAVDIATCTGSNVNEETIADSPGVESPVLLPLSPGSAGQINTLSLTNARPNTDVGFVYGFSETPFRDNVDGHCPAFLSSILNAKLLPLVRSNEAGEASLVVNVPSSLAGTSLLIQAADTAFCKPSNVNAETL